MIVLATLLIFIFAKIITKQRAIMTIVGLKYETNNPENTGENTLTPHEIKTQIAIVINAYFVLTHITISHFFNHAPNMYNTVSQAKL